MDGITNVKTIIAFDDIVEFMKTTEEVQSQQSILEYLKENFDPELEQYRAGSNERKKNKEKRVS